MTFMARARIAGLVAIGLLSLVTPVVNASPLYSPDAEIRTGSGSYVGYGIVNKTATNQTVTNSALVDQKLTFWIRITNGGALTDSFKVRRSCCFHEGYRVRYYDANGTDVTGKVTAGSFTTPVLAADGGQYEMRATVKVRSLAAPGSFVNRLMTVTSVGNSTLKDAVRLIAGVSDPPNNAPVANTDVNSVNEDDSPNTVPATCSPTTVTSTMTLWSPFSLRPFRSTGS